MQWTKKDEEQRPALNCTSPEIRLTLDSLLL